MSGHILHQLRFQGEKTYPEECCGVLLGTQLDGIRTIHSLIEIHNSRVMNREQRFLITPEQYMNAEKTARNQNLELLGFYHSHPDHPASPSQFDTEHALPSMTYIIVSVMRGRGGIASAWELSPSRRRFDEQLLVVEKGLNQTGNV